MSEGKHGAGKFYARGSDARQMYLNVRRLSGIVRSALYVASQCPALYLGGILPGFKDGSCVTGRAEGVGLHYKPQRGRMMGVHLRCSYG